MNTSSSKELLFKVLNSTASINDLAKSVSRDLTFATESSRFLVKVSMITDFSFILIVRVSDCDT